MALDILIGYFKKKLGETKNIFCINKIFYIWKVNANEETR